MKSPTVAAVVLAAGSSSRMGKPKQLIKFQGKTLIRRTVEAASASLTDLVVVTTANNGVDFDKELDGLDWICARVENPERGQAESVQTGLGTATEHGEFAAILFTPCDLPLLSTEHLDSLLREYRKGVWRIVASRYDGVLGAPLIIGREIWPEIRQLRGDAGVRKLLPAHKDSIGVVEWEEGKFDLDTPEDVEALRRGELPGQ